MKEKRCAPRVRVFYPLIYIEKGKGRFPLVGSSETNNITPRGACFPIFHALSPESHLYLAVYIEFGADPVTVIAEPRWVRSFEGGSVAMMGVKFLKLTPHDRRRLREIEVASAA